MWPTLASEVDFELLIQLSPLLECGEYRHAPPHWSLGSLRFLNQDKYMAGYHIVSPMINLSNFCFVFWFSFPKMYVLIWKKETLLLFCSHFFLKCQYFLVYSFKCSI